MVGPRSRHPAHLAPGFLLRAELKEGVEDLVLVEPLPVVESPGHEDPLPSLHRRVLAPASTWQPGTHAPRVGLCVVPGEGGGCTIEDGLMVE